MTDVPALLVVGVLLVALFTAGGMAVRSVSRIWLRHWAERRLQGADAALTFLDRPHRLLAASSAAVSVVVVLMGVALAAWEGEPAWHRPVAAVVTVLALVLVGQILARAVARRWSVRVVPALLPLLRVAQLVTWPPLAAGRAVARMLVRPAPGAVAAPERDSLQDLLREGELEGVGEHAEIAIITGVVEFGEKRVRDVMTPWERVHAVDESTPPVDLAHAIARVGYSRVPIVRGGPDAVVGMVHVFDVLKAAGEAPAPLRPVAFADPDTRCNELLVRMLRGRFHLAVVRDDASRPLGIVTLEDLLEELVGDIRDEHDEPADEAGAAPAAAGPSPDRTTTPLA